MKFLWCTVSVKNLEESIEFYQDIVGLEISKRFKAGPDSEICFMGVGETQIELISGGNQNNSENIEGISIGFEVDSIDKKMALILDKGFKIHSGPFQPNPHVKFFFVKDLNGVSVQFVENI